MNRMILSLSLVVLLPAKPVLAADAPTANELPAHRAADSAAAAVTADNLLESERFWPYRLSLRRTWKPADGDRLIASGSTGVLIRVEEGGSARVDFGRDGIHDVPVGETDLVESANRIRTGELDKQAPNFVLSMGPRLLDPAAEPLAAFPLLDAYGQRAFLTVFGDLKQLAAMAPTLAPLAGRRGVLTILLPQGEHPNAQVREELRRIGWAVPFVYDHLAEAYTPSLLPSNLEPPAVVLQTAEGRVLFASRWGTDVGARLAAALEAEVGGEPAP
jgi:hypothetical protein